MSKLVHCAHCAELPSLDKWWTKLMTILWGTLWTSIYLSLAKRDRIPFLSYNPFDDYIFLDLASCSTVKQTFIQGKQILVRKFTTAISYVKWKQGFASWMDQKYNLFSLILNLRHFIDLPHTWVEFWKIDGILSHRTPYLQEHLCQNSNNEMLWQFAWILGILEASLVTFKW